jgi:hypothetical protein
VVDAAKKFVLLGAPMNFPSRPKTSGTLYSIVARMLGEFTMTDTDHAFNYWHAINTVSNPQERVSAQVIEFLNAHR